MDMLEAEGRGYMKALRAVRDHIRYWSGRLAWAIDEREPEAIEDLLDEFKNGGRFEIAEEGEPSTTTRRGEGGS